MDDKKISNKKFTDEEIIKSLECCVKAKTMGDCIELNCPFRNDWDLCLSGEIKKMALDLINRQKAEIERLEKTYKADQQLISALNKSYNLAKAEAYKEFADKLKEKSEIVHLFSVCNGHHYMVDIDDIDNLVKEMVGEEE